MKNLMVLGGFAALGLALLNVVKQRSQAEESARKANVMQDNIDAVARFEKYGGGF